MLTTNNHGIFDLTIIGDIAIMDFNPEGDRYPEELINSSFERECRYLQLLHKYNWSPEVLFIVPEFRQIYFKWYGNTCEETVPNNYKEQLEQITKDLHSEGIYKPSFYTKYFYVDDEDVMHAYAFYSASDYAEQPISMDFYQPILNPQRKALIDTLVTNGTLDMGTLVKHGFNDYIKWPGDVLPEIYRTVYQS